jgi:hypothetical protein
MNDRPAKGLVVLAGEEESGLDQIAVRHRIAANLSQKKGKANDFFYDNRERRKWI